MPKKLTYEFVKQAFEKKGYTLLSEEYINSKQKLNYICPNGHKHNVQWSNWWYRRSRCPYCSNNAKPNVEEIKAKFESEGYSLLSDNYINNKAHLHFICPNGHKHKIKWNSWVSGQRCGLCCINRPPTYNFVKDSFKLEGYTLISKEYVNSAEHLEYVCPLGHKSSTSWFNWQAGYRCKFCANNVRLTLDFVKEEFSKEGYIVLSNEYINNRTKLDYMCPLGHIQSIRWDDWRHGYRCPTCHTIRITGKGNPAWKGGISFEPYCEIWKDAEYKQDIRDRDGNKCLNPYCDSKYPDDLVIHHIDYNKKNCKPSNLITVCRSCNVKANKNRNWHKAWYQAIINKRYNYKY